MKRPTWSDLPDDLRARVEAQPADVQQLLAGLRDEGHSGRALCDLITVRLDASEVSAAIAGTVKLTPEELAMSEDERAQHWVRLSTANFEAMRAERRRRDRGEG